MQIADKKPLPPGLHLILGDAAAGIFTRVFQNAREQLIVDTDALSHGPTPARASLVDWHRMRARYWTDLSPSEPTTREFINPILDQAHRFKDAPVITIWAATGLDEWLFIASCIHLADSAGVDPERLRLVQFDVLPLDRSRLMGMGFLNEATLAAHPEPRPFSAEALQDLRGLWSALTSKDPQAFATYATRFPDAHPWMHEAAKLMLRRFPDERSGLPYWDRVLLEVARKRAPNVLRTIADTMTKDWNDPDLVSDWVLFGRILRLADSSLPRPLFKLNGLELAMRDTTIELTTFGHKVLEGRASHLSVNPIDDWAAGVRLLSSDGRIWFTERGRVKQMASEEVLPGEWSIS